MAEKDAIEASVLQPLYEFAVESRSLLDKCERPNREEFLRIAFVTGFGFLILGALGFLVKIVHIPINNLLVGGS